MQTLQDHVSIRKYKQEQIPDELLHSIISAGCRASTTGNMQLYSIVNTMDAVIKAKLAPAHFNQAMITQAPNVLTFCADFNRFNRWCVLNNAVPGYANFLSFTTALIDAILVAQNVCIAAESHGLGICYLGTTIYNAKEIIEVLNLPKGVVPVTTVTIGWPDEKPERMDRLPLEAVLHTNTYVDYSDQNIRDVYQEKENREDNKKFVMENGKETLAQVFTDVRYTKQGNDFFSQKLLKIIKEQGFEF